MDRKLGQLVLASLLLLSLASIGEAQGSIPGSDRVTTAGPTVAAAASAVRWVPEQPAAMIQGESSSVVLAMAASRRSQSKVLMIVGGAAILVGAIAGDDAGTILIVGGAGFGLYGLYLYLTS